LRGVHGIATAAGCQLVASCDLAVAADVARFAVMKVLVPVKRVIDYNVKVRVKPDGRASSSPTSRCR
jgi:hypothetical protein